MTTGLTSAVNELNISRFKRGIFFYQVLQKTAYKKQAVSF